MTSSQVTAVFLLALTFHLSTGQEIEFGHNNPYTPRNQDFTCSLKATPKVRMFLQMSMSAVTDDAEERLAVLSQKSPLETTEDPKTLNATGVISHKKARLSLIRKESPDIEKYICRISYINRGHKKSDLEVVVDNKGGRWWSLAKNNFVEHGLKGSFGLLDNKVNRLYGNTENLIDNVNTMNRKRTGEILNETALATSSALDKVVSTENKTEVLLEKLLKIQKKIDDLSKKFDLFEQLLAQVFDRRCEDVEDGPRLVNFSHVAVVNRRHGAYLLCDRETDGGGWTIFQRRVDALNFNKDWASYEMGFGSVEGSFWLGLKLLSTLTAEGKWELRVDLDFEGRKQYARYSQFKVGDASTNYKLYVKGYSGNAGDSLADLHSNMAFSTYDRDNDSSSGQNCAEGYTGGWWFNSCLDSNLNALWDVPGFKNGVLWGWLGLHDTPSYTEMKMRRVQ